MNDSERNASRRRFLTVGAVTAGALPFVAGRTAAQETSSENGNGETDGGSEFRNAIASRDSFYSGAVFRVVSPPLENAPSIEEIDALRNHVAYTIELFNTNEEGLLYVPQDVRLEKGEQYVYDDRLSSPTEQELTVNDFVRVQFRRLTDADLPFEFARPEDFDVLEDSGGEAAVRPDNFYSGAMFRITSGAQGWVPDDVGQSGLFTDYNTVHAEYVGTNHRFLLFAQEAATTETGQTYVMRDEPELFDPAGNLVATEFNTVDEDSITIDDEFLR